MTDAQKEKIEKLLNEAEKIMNENIDKEIKLLEGNSWANIESEKYQKAKKIFEKVLSINPTNKRAHEGISACLEMIEPYVPVQYMVDTSPPSPEDLKALTLNLEKSAEGKLPESPKLKPWEMRRNQRMRDKRGLEYTGRVFAKDSEKAKENIQKIVNEAKIKLMTTGKDPQEIYDETVKIIEEYQDGLHRGWKGHGPEILDDAIQLLKKALGL